MKFVCLGFFDESAWNALPGGDRNSFLEQCFAYDDELRRGGHFRGGEALQSAQNAASLRYRNRQVVVTDGPYVETKEHLGGIVFLEARDLNHAIQLMSGHPGIRAGGFELRAVDEEFTALVASRDAAYGTPLPSGERG